MPTTPDMNLVLPDVLVTIGPTWATQINAALSTIDSHDHSSGKGLAITPSGLNISSDLTFAQNNATNLRTARFYNNTSFTPGVNDKTCFYTLNNELYFIDGAGNTIQVTSGGVLNVSVSLTSLTLKDNTFTLQYAGDITKQFLFNGSALTSATTNTLNVPNLGSSPSNSDTITTLAATQTVTNKTLGSTNTLTGAKMASLTPNGSNTITFPVVTDTVVTLAAPQTITNKDVSGNTSTGFVSGTGSFTFNTSQAVTVQNVAGSLAALGATQIFTGANSFNNVTLRSASTLSFNNSGNTFATTFTAGANVANYAVTLPIADGTSGQVLTTNGSGVWSWSTVASNNAVVAANDSNKTFTNADGRFQTCTPTAARTYTLPTTSILAGDTWTFYNQATSASNYITIQSSGSNQVCILPPLGYVVLQAAVNTPTTAANWIVVTKQSQWVSYTPTVTGLGTVTGLVAYFKNAGDSLWIRFYCVVATPSSALISVTLPTPFTIGAKVFATLNNVSSPSISNYFMQGNANGQGPVLVSTSSSTTLIYFGQTSNNAAALTPTTGTGLSSSGYILTFTCEVPLV